MEDHEYRPGCCGSHHQCTPACEHPMQTWTVTDSLKRQHYITAAYVGTAANGYVNFFDPRQPNMNIVATFFQPVSVVLQGSES